MDLVVRPLRLAVAAAVACGLVVTALATSVAAAPTIGRVVESASGVPYQDPNAVGAIGLCNEAGSAITHGNINTKPFVWRAVSSQAAQAPYDSPGRTATLYAYQPQRDLPSGDWSGDALTASARYTNAAHPMAAATSGDLSLKQFMGEFRPVWDGLLELRIFLGAPNQAGYSLTYPATDIKVTGNTWRVVSGGNVSCRSGRATSIESILLPKKALKHSAKSHPRAHASGTAAAAPNAGAAPSAGAGAAASHNVASQQASTQSGGHTGLVVGILIAACLLVVGGGVVADRRGSRAAARAAADTRSGTSRAKVKVEK
jgi:hypothetical protein